MTIMKLFVSALLWVLPLAPAVLAEEPVFSVKVSLAVENMGKPQP